jgi:hypothetical protein
MGEQKALFLDKINKKIYSTSAADALLDCTDFK